jgi:hypothetical protein
MRRALAPVRWWIRLYTLGLPPTIREERRAELDSDLWEEWHQGSVRGLDALSKATSMWTRWLLGIPDDLAWRVELMLRQASPGSESKGRLVGLSAGVVVAIALVLVIVAINTVQYNEGTQPSGEAASILLLLACGIAVVGIATAARGFGVMDARRTEGALLVVGGSTVAGLAWYWLFFPVVAALGVSVFGIWRAVGLADVMKQRPHRCGGADEEQAATHGQDRRTRRE